MRISVALKQLHSNTLDSLLLGGHQDIYSSLSHANCQALCSMAEYRTFSLPNEYSISGFTSFCLEHVTRRYIDELGSLLRTGKAQKTLFGDVNDDSLVFAIKGMDKQLEHLYPHIFCAGGLPYIELGANDGFNQSNTLYFELKYGMKGVLIEPLPSKYEILLTTRSPDSFFKLAAAVPNDFPSATVTLNANNLMTVSEIDSVTCRQLSDLDAPLSHAQSDDPRLNHTISVPACTLQSVINETGWQEFSLLSVDVEGNELSVMEGIDFDSTTFLLRNLWINGVRPARAVRQRCFEHSFALRPPFAGFGLVFGS